MVDGIDRAAVFKQRRFLLSLVFAIAVFHVFNVSFSGHLPTPVVDIKYDPTNLTVGLSLWTCGLWAFYRYYLYERTFKNDALDLHRQKVAEDVYREVLNESIQRATRAGLYEARKVPRTATVELQVVEESNLRPVRQKDGWFFGNLPVKIVRDDSEVEWLDGGANCTLTASEMDAVQRQITRALLTGYPHFTDFKLPYYLAALAPVALVIDVVRRSLIP